MVTTAAAPAYESVHTIDEPSLGLFGAVAIHSTRLGPAAGGCRIWTYPDRGALIDDALRLSRGMTYKNALAGLPLGGGKAVLQIEPSADRRAALHAFGTAVERLGGSYITAEDVGATVQDLQTVAERTRYVSGLPRDGRDAAGGDPSPWTALGVFLSIEAALARRSGRTLDGATVAVQGLGAVGGRLCQMLTEGGARLVVADADPARARLQEAVNAAQVHAPQEIHAAAVDVFAPCALGGALDARTVPAIRAAVVCGAANNQLADETVGAELARRGILYAPDYLVNAGGIISVAAEWLGETRGDVEARVREIPRRLEALFERAAREGIEPGLAADRTVEELLLRAPARKAA